MSIAVNVVANLDGLKSASEDDIIQVLGVVTPKYRRPLARALLREFVILPRNK